MLQGIKRYLSKPEQLVLALMGVPGLVVGALLILAAVTGDRAYGRYAQWVFYFMLIVALLPFVAFLVAVVLETLSKLVKRILLVIVCIGVSGLTSNAFSDSRPYSGSLRISDGGKAMRVVHDHTRAHGRDWYRSQMGVKQFSECDHTASNQGILQVFRRSDRLFCTAVPALTHIWLSPDEKYVVGLSNIMHDNPFQLIVYSTKGELLFQRAIDCRELDIEGCRTSITNSIYWFHETHPGIALQESANGTLELSVNSPFKSRIRFVFPEKPETALDQTPCGRNWQRGSAESYWYSYVFGSGRVAKERGDVVCVSVQRGQDRDYYFIPRQAFDERSTKEKVFLEYAEIAIAFLFEPGATRQSIETNTTILTRVTGQSFTTKEQWLQWWEQHQGRLRLSNDGEYLTIR
jgi:hypothetical protein